MVTQERARWSRSNAENDTAASSLQLAQILMAEGRFPEAEAFCTEALERKQQRGERDGELAMILNTRAAIFLERGAPAAARRDATDAVYALAGVIAAGDERVAALCLVARSHMAEERYHEARPMLERALTMCHQTGTAAECRVRIVFGDLCRQSGAIEEAEEHYRFALSLADRLHGVHATESGAICHRLALLAEDSDDPGVFERYARRAYEIRCSTFGSTHPLTAASQAAVASVLEACGEVRQAGEKYLHALAIFDRQYATPSYDGYSANVDILRDYAFCRRGACRKLIADGRAVDAREFSARAQRVFERYLGKRHPLVKQWAKEHDSLMRMGRGGFGHTVRYSAWEWWRSLAG